ncbi:MAG: glycosyltransferase [Candidatus Aenigmatarchaeota archaeon]
MNRRRVVHVLSSSGFAGAEKVVSDIVNNLSSKYDFLVISYPNKDLREFVRAKIEFYNNVFDLWRLIYNYRPNIIHAHDYRASLKVVILKILGMNSKIISHIHANPKWAQKLNLFTFIFFIASFLIDKIVYVSEAARKEFFFSKFLKNKTEVVYNSISNFEDAYKDEHFFRDIDIVFLGRFVDKKRPKLFIEVIKLLPQKYIVYMIGDGPLRAEIEKSAPSNVIFTGWVKDPRPLLKRAKVLLVTSQYEGFGLVILEALSAGVIPVSTKCGGPEEIIINGKTGFLVDDDPITIATLLKEILDNYENYQQVILHNVGNVIIKFSRKNFLENIDKVYGEI